MEVQTVEIGSITPYENNPRRNRNSVGKVADSLKEYGWQQPIVVDEDMVVIAGHTRLQAAKRLKMKQVPIQVAVGLTPEQTKAYRIMDNRSGEDSAWIDDLLKTELTGLLEEGFDLALTGFSGQELNLLMAVTDDREGADDIPEDIETRCKPGDLWILGKHRLLCGDATIPDDVARLCGEDLVDVFLTDPPYNVGLGSNYPDPSVLSRRTDGKIIKNDVQEEAQFRQFLRAAFENANSVMKAGATFYIWHADNTAYEFRGACIDSGWKVRQGLVWNKSHMVMGRQDYHWKHEPCLYGWKGGAAHLWAADRKQVTVLDFARPSSSDDHPTMKPVALFEYQIKNNTKGSDLVLDTFAGSGTSVIACEKSGRVARAMELDPAYCDVILRRWEIFTGQEATLAEGHA